MAKQSTIRKKRKRDPYAERYSSAEFRPYALAIGQVALAWNDLNETLGSLFVNLVGAGIDDKVQAAWQALTSDRSKRDMLKAAIGELSLKEERLNPSAKVEMKWLFGQLERLEIERNHAIHAPLASFSHPIWRMDVLGLNMPEGVAPDDIRGNRLASKLVGKNLLAEYRFIRDEAIILRDYIEDIESAWNWTDKRPNRWPERPRLPNRGMKKMDSSQPRGDSPTQHVLPLKSPPE